MGGFGEFRQSRPSELRTLRRVAAIRWNSLKVCHEFDLQNDNGLRCYLTRNVQKEVNARVKSWWKNDHLDSEYMDNETLAMWRSWKFTLFRDGWFYRLFLAFGNRWWISLMNYSTSVRICDFGKASKNA